MGNNRTIKLSKRLSAAEFAVRRGCRAADIGCDHGKLAARLILSGRCRFVYAVDISKPSLKKAADLFSALGIQDRAATLESDGLSEIEADAVDDVIIAGVGFDTTEHIVSGCGWLKNKDKQLILVPNSRHPQTRRYLCAEGFELVSERAVFENERVYTVMTCVYSGVAAQITPEFAAIGKILESCGDNREYLRMVRKSNESLLRGVRRSPSADQSKIEQAEIVLKALDSITATEVSTCQSTR